MKKVPALSSFVASLLFLAAQPRDVLAQAQVITCNGGPCLGVTNNGTDTSSAWAIRATSFNSVGLVGSSSGTASTSNGIVGESLAANGIYGKTAGCGSCGQNSVAGVYGTSTASPGVGVRGNVGNGGTGVWGNAGNGGYGVFGVAGTTGYSIYGLNTTGGYAGYFNANVYVVGNTSTGTLTNRSDARLKKDVADAGYGLAQVLKLRPVRYQWKHEGSDPGVQLGLIAQEVQKLIPEVVRPDSKDGMLAVNYVALVPVVIKAVQEQDQIIKKQEERLARLERAARAPVMSSLSGGLALGLLPLGLFAVVRRARKRRD